MVRDEGIPSLLKHPSSTRFWTRAGNSACWPCRGADTATSAGRLMIAVLWGLADVERDAPGRRTAEGRSRAKARGQHMSRPPKFTTQQQKDARWWRAEGATLAELAMSYNVGRATISRLSP